MAAPTTILLRIYRQESASDQPYWQEFRIPYVERFNVISALMEIRKNPVSTEGVEVSPPVWECACLEEVCGSCTMVVNGTIRQACTALIDDVGVQAGDTTRIDLEPLKKFPKVRDLLVDRNSMFESLIKVKAWVPIDGSFDRGMAVPQDDEVRKLRYELSRCMTCGCCMEACPQYGAHSSFIGPAPIGQALLFNLHPVGKTLEKERLQFLTGEEGVTGCGNAQNCVKVCPKGVPLTQSIAQLNRDTTVFKFRQFFGLGT